MSLLSLHWELTVQWDSDHFICPRCCNVNGVKEQNWKGEVENGPSEVAWHRKNGINRFCYNGFFRLWMQKHNRLFSPFSLDLPSGFISPRYPRPISIADFSIDDRKLHCPSVSWRCDRVKSPTPHRALSPRRQCRPFGCNLVVPGNNNAIDFALGGAERWPLNRPLLLVPQGWKSHHRPNLSDWSDRIWEVRRRHWGYVASKILGNFFFFLPRR